MEKKLKIARENLSESAINNLEIWLNDTRYNSFKRYILDKIEHCEWPELEDSFCNVLEFGTAGRRGRVGVGPNRVNEVTIAESAQALADYLKSENIKKPSVAIAWDVRTSSLGLSKVCAEVLSGNGVKVYFFDSFRSTPELSFAVRYLKASAGIVISASHNPPEDNGIKIYWSDGAQVSSPHDINIMNFVKKVNMIKKQDFSKALDDGLIKIIGEKVDNAYISKNIKLSRTKNRSASIIFSPIHGTGWTNLLKTLIAANFEQISVVKEQMPADGNFSTLLDHKPNPENISANIMAINQLKDKKFDIALTTDPDADRICVMSLEKNGNVRCYSGNETAVLVADYILSKNAKPKFYSAYFNDKNFICKSFVTTDTLNILAKKYSVDIYDNMMVGFKFIGKMILKQENKEYKFLAGFEESLGGLVGSQVRDKDASTIGLAISELASELKSEGKTLGERLDEIYQEVGYFTEKTESIEFTGFDGMEKISRIMKKIRGNNIELGATYKKDYKSLQKINLKTGKEEQFEMVQGGNAISFEFDNPHNRITIRPSGTEPKIKIYTQWLFDNKQEKNKITEIINDFKERILNEC